MINPAQEIVLGIIIGDHAGSSPEIVAKAVLANDGSYIPVLVGNRERFEISRNVVAGGEQIKLRELNGRPIEGGKNIAYFYDIPAGPDIQFSTITADSGKLTFESIIKTLDLEKEGVIDGIAMAPITKAAFHAADLAYASEFEIFSEYYEQTSVGTVIKCENIFRSTVVGHCAFREIADRLTTQGIVRTGQNLLNTMKKFLPAEQCKIAVAALNPHAGEDGLFGNEESTVIQPAIDELRAAGELVIGPSPADTVFLKARSGEVGGVVFLYHDQGNIAMKSCFFGDGVLIYTVPSFLVSVGHGPAYGKAGKGTADPKNMISSMEVLCDLVKNQRNTKE